MLQGEHSCFAEGGEQGMVGYHSMIPYPALMHVLDKPGLFDRQLSTTPN